MLPVSIVDCPYCGEAIEIVIDDSLEQQRYIEDCSVCCRPIDIEVSVGPDAEVDVICRAENEI